MATTTTPCSLCGHPEIFVNERGLCTYVTHSTGEPCLCPHFETPIQPNDPNSPQTHLEYRTDLLLPDWLLDVAHVLHQGATKYGDNSWKTLPIDDHLNHAMVHIQQYRAGDRSEQHLINIVCRMMFAYWCDKHGQQLVSHEGLPIAPGLSAVTLDTPTPNELQQELDKHLKLAVNKLPDHIAGDTPQ